MRPMPLRPEQIRAIQARRARERRDAQATIPLAKRINGMNLSTTIFLVNKKVRSVRVSYEEGRQSNACQLFKTLNPDLKKDDLVIVPTSTRYGMTVVKVVETDFPVDFEGAEDWKWVIGNVDAAAYKTTLEEEERVTTIIRRGEENRKRAELAATLNLASIDLEGLSIATEAPVLPAPATIRG